MICHCMYFASMAGSLRSNLINAKAGLPCLDLDVTPSITAEEASEVVKEDL